MNVIYIIEDNENIRWELRDFLQKNGYETVCPADPEELEALLAKKPADLILLDIRLGGVETDSNSVAASAVPIICPLSSSQDSIGRKMNCEDFP